MAENERGVTEHALRGQSAERCCAKKLVSIPVNPKSCYIDGFHVTSSFSKTKKHNPSEVLLSSDVRPSNHLTFYKVCARQGSSVILR